MQSAPLFNEPAAGGAARICRESHERLVGRQDDDQRIRPVANQRDRARQPTPIAGEPPGPDAEKTADQGQRTLQGETALIGRLPFPEQSTVIQAQPGGLFGDVDVDDLGGEERGRRQSEVTNQHLLSHLSLAAAIPGIKVGRGEPVLQIRIIAIPLRGPG